MGNPQFKAAIEAMKKSFNYIIVDCTPIGAVIDAAVVAKSVDGMVMVIEQKKVSRRMAQKMKEQLEASGCPLLGVVLNKVKISENKSYGGYGLYYGHYGKYGEY